MKNLFEEELYIHEQMYFCIRNKRTKYYFIVKPFAGFRKRFQNKGLPEEYILDIAE